MSKSRKISAYTQQLDNWIKQTLIDAKAFDTVAQHFLFDDELGDNIQLTGTKISNVKRKPPSRREGLRNLYKVLGVFLAFEVVTTDQIEVFFDEHQIEMIDGRSRTQVMAFFEQGAQKARPVAKELQNSLRQGVPKTSTFPTLRVLLILAVLLIVGILIVIGNVISASPKLCASITDVNEITNPNLGFTLYTAETEKNILSNNVRSVSVGMDRVYVGYKDSSGVNGFSFFDGSLWYHCLGLYQASRSTNDFLEKDGDIFIAVDQEGVLRTNLSDVETYSTTDSELLSNAVFSFIRFGETNTFGITSWEGVFEYIDGGWFLHDRPSNDGNRTDHIYDMVADSDGGYWFSSIDNGLYYQSNTGSWQDYFGEIEGVRNTRALAFSKEQNVLWAGSDGGGLLQFDGNNWAVFSVENGNFPTDHVFDVDLDMYGRIWVATNVGLYFSNDGGGSWSAYSRVQVLDIDFGCDLCSYDGSHIWFVIDKTEQDSQSGIAHGRIPPLHPTIRTIAVPADVILQPQQEYVFDIEVEVLAEQLQFFEQSGDALIIVDADDIDNFGVHTIIPVTSQLVSTGATYIFRNNETPLIAPSDPGEYELHFRVWQNNRYVTDIITLAFQVQE